MNVTDSVKHRVATKIGEVVRKLNEQFPTANYTAPSYDFNLRGTTAGVSYNFQNRVSFNAVLLMENVDEFINDTVPHEVCHAACDHIYGDVYTGGRSRFGRRKRSIHGPEWKGLMRVVGADPSRCHRFDTTNSKVRTKASFTYTCSCGIEHKLGPKRHARQQQLHSYHCTKCRSGLTFIGATTLVAAKAPAPKNISPKSGTKKDVAMQWFKKRMQQTGQVPNRSDMINIFVEHLGMSKAGAQTYYYNIKKELGI